jgi:hypothetical protein
MNFIVALGLVKKASHIDGLEVLKGGKISAEKPPLLSPGKWVHLI